jgi:putative peptidoglycan lipid II flippase
MLAMRAVQNSAPLARIARNTVIFSVATGLSRVAGLGREIVASSYFGTSGPFSAFTIAFQVPNLVRSLFADAALSAAFVPVFTELLEHKQRKEAFRLASTLFFLILAVLGTITAFFVLAAPTVMPWFTGGEFTDELDRLTGGLAQVMFPIVVLLGVNGLLVGIMNAYDHFTIPALSPVVWNLVILAFLVFGRGWFDEGDELYAYAIGVVAGTVVQLAMAVPVLRRLGFRLEWSLSLRDPRVKRVLMLMLPVTIGLGLINFNLLINSVLGSLVSEEAPRAIDAAFRVYMLPQGMFSVAIATVLFPALSRLAARGDRDGLRALNATGTRQVFLLLVPAAACTLALAEPITRLIYERGAFGPDDTERVASALLWFSFSLPFSGVNLLLTRTFFSLQRPWIPTGIAVLGLLLNIAVSVALYRPFGIPGIVAGTVVGTAATTVFQARYLRRELAGRIEARATVLAFARMLLAAALLALVAILVHRVLEGLLGTTLTAQAVAVGVALLAGLAAYAGAVIALRVEEALYLRRLVAGRLRRRADG